MTPHRAAKAPGAALLPGMLLLGAVLGAMPALAQRPTVEVTVDVAPASARIVLTHSRQVALSVGETDGRVEIVYAEPVIAVPAERSLSGGILDRWELRDGTRLTLHTGPSYRGYESFELRNPFRLVLDLRGSLSAEEEVARVRARPDVSQTIVVIDPGHGGIEHGAIGPTGLREKDVTLDLARRLRRELQEDRTVSVVLTRDEDRLLGLDERTAIANHNRASLFISIHLNASSRAKAQGAETYFLSTDATDDEARTLAALENRAAKVDEDAIVYTSDGERRDLDLVLWDLAQNRYLAESSLLAESVQRELNELTGTRDRGVRQAPFRVLMGATMPAILVEVGFISNGDEESRLKDSTYRNRVTDALAAAVRDYLAEMKRAEREDRRRGGRP